MVAAGTLAAFVGGAGPAQAKPKLVHVEDDQVHLLTAEFADRVRAASAGRLAETCYIVAIQNIAETRYVSAELDYTGSSYGMLRARADIMGPYEKFNYCWNTAGYFSLQSRANGRWVAAEMDNSGSSYAMLRARSNSVGNWEKFSYWTNSGIWLFRSQSNNRWVRAEINYSGASDGMLRASYVSSSVPSGVSDNTIKFWRPLVGP